MLRSLVLVTITGLLASWVGSYVYDTYTRPKAEVAGLSSGHVVLCSPYCVRLEYYVDGNRYHQTVGLFAMCSREEIVNYYPKTIKGRSLINVVSINRGTVRGYYASP